jgi:hypothetical protein
MWPTRRRQRPAVRGRAGWRDPVIRDGVSSASVPRHPRADRQRRRTGLLGLAFHPDYPSDRGSSSTTDVNGDTWSPRTPSTRQAWTGRSASETSVEGGPAIREPQRGAVVFGPDGMLYIAWATAGRVAIAGQRPAPRYALARSCASTSMTRPGSTYRPPDNPFVATSGAKRDLADHLRNPWRMWFDQPTRDLWIGDVTGTRGRRSTSRESGPAAELRLEPDGGLPLLRAGERLRPTGLTMPVTEHGTGRLCRHRRRRRPRRRQASWTAATVRRCGSTGCGSSIRPWMARRLPCSPRDSAGRLLDRRSRGRDIYATSLDRGE